MKHLSWKYRKRRTAQEYKEFCEAQRARVAKRWLKRTEQMQDEPVRVDRVIVILIRDSHRPQTEICLKRIANLGRWHGIGSRGLGTGRVARLIAEFLQ